MALTLSGTNGVVGAGFTVDASGVSVTAGVGTFSSIGAGVSVAAAGLHGTMPTIDGSALTSINAAQLVGVCTSGLSKTGGFGNILQVVKTNVTASSSYGSSANSHYTLTPLNTTITPIGTNSHFIVSAQVSGEANSNANANIFLRLIRNTTSGFADGDNVKLMTKKINGGSIGLEDRQRRYINAMEVLGMPFEIHEEDDDDDGFPGIDFALTSDGVTKYSTPFYGGSDSVSAVSYTHLTLPTKRIV